MLQNQPSCENNDIEIYNIFYDTDNAPKEYDDDKKLDFKCRKKDNVVCDDYFVFYYMENKKSDDEYYALCISCHTEIESVQVEVKYPNNCLCDDDEYYDPFKDDCKKCSKHCTSCYFDFFVDQREKCYECVSGKGLDNSDTVNFNDVACDCDEVEGYKFNNEGICTYNQCDSGHYFDGTECQTCQSLFLLHDSTEYIFKYCSECTISSSYQPICQECVEEGFEIVDIDIYGNGTIAQYCACPDTQFPLEDNNNKCGTCKYGTYFNQAVYDQCKLLYSCSDKTQDLCGSCSDQFDQKCLDCIIFDDLTYGQQLLCLTCSKNGIEPYCNYCEDNQYYDFTNDTCFLDNPTILDGLGGVFTDCMQSPLNQNTAYAEHCHNCTQSNKYCLGCTDIIEMNSTASICTLCTENRIPPNCLCPNSLVPSKDNPEKCMECSYGTFYNIEKDLCLINQNFDCFYEDICFSCKDTIHEYCLECEVGQQTKTCKQCQGDFTVYNVNNTFTSCQCPKGTFHYDVTTSECEICPQNAQCPGGRVIVLDPGYWRENDQSFEVLECSNPDACQGGSDNFTCSKGYIGALCQECDLNGDYWGDNYGNTSEYECNSCNEALQVFQFLLLGLLMTALTFYIVFSQVKEVEQEQKKLCFNSIFKQRGGETLDKSRIYYKILQQYFAQAVILTDLGVDMGSFLNGFIDNFSNPAGQISSSTDCLVVGIFGVSIPPLYSKILFLHFTFLLFMTTSCGLVSYLKASKFQKSKKITYYNRKLDNKNEYRPDDFYQSGLKLQEIILMVFIFLFMENQQSYVQVMIESVSCEQISGTKYTIADSSVTCDSKNYAFFTLLFSSPLLIFWAFGVPIFILYKLRQASKRPKFKKDIPFYHKTLQNSKELNIQQNQKQNEKNQMQIPFSEINKDFKIQNQIIDEKNQLQQIKYERSIQQKSSRQQPHIDTQNDKTINEDWQKKQNVQNQPSSQQSEQDVDLQKDESWISKEKIIQNDEKDGEIDNTEFFENSEKMKNDSQQQNNTHSNQLLVEQEIQRMEESLKFQSDDAIKKLFFFSDNKQTFLDHRVFQYQFGFIYMEYEERSYFWDIIRILQKSILIFLVSMYNDSVYVKGTMGFIVIICYALLVKNYQPFKEKSINLLELQGTLIISVSLVIVLFIYENQHIYLVVVGGLILGIMNFYFVGKIIYLILHDIVIENWSAFLEAVSKIKIKKLDFIIQYAQNKRVKQLKTLHHWGIFKNNLFFSFYVQKNKRKYAQILKRYPKRTFLFDKNNIYLSQISNDYIVQNEIEQSKDKLIQKQFGLIIRNKFKLKPWENVGVSKPAIVRNLNQNIKEFYNIFNFKAQQFPLQDDINAQSEQFQTQKSHRSDYIDELCLNVNNIDLQQGKQSDQQTNYFNNENDNGIDSTILSPLKVIRSNQKFIDNDNQLYPNNFLSFNNYNQNLTKLDNQSKNAIQEEKSFEIDFHMLDNQNIQDMSQNLKQNKQSNMLNNENGKSKKLDQESKLIIESNQNTQILNKKSLNNSKNQQINLIPPKQLQYKNSWNDHAYNEQENLFDSQEFNDQNKNDISENISQNLGIQDIELTDIDKNQFMTNTFKELQKLNQKDFQDKQKIRKKNGQQESGQTSQNQKNNMHSIKIEKSKQNRKNEESRKISKSNVSVSKIQNNNLSVQLQKQSQQFLRDKNQSKKSKNNQNNNNNNSSTEKSSIQYQKNNTNILNNQSSSGSNQQDLQIQVGDQENFKKSQRMGSSGDNIHNDSQQQSDDNEKQVQFFKKEVFQISQSEIQEVEDQNDENEDSLIL